MADDTGVWDVTRRCCGNCEYWQLSGYGQNEWNAGTLGVYTRPYGSGGYHCNGEYSPCVRHAPVGAADKNGSVVPVAIWPKTAREDWCGDFTVRPGYGAERWRGATAREKDGV